MNLRKQYKLDPMDVDLSPQILLQLLEEELLDVIVARQVRRKEKEGHTDDKEDGTEDNENARSEHSSSID